MTKKRQPHISPHIRGLMLAPKDLSPEMLRPLARGQYDWHPERSAEGPITIVMSSSDRAIYVYRNGNFIRRAELEIAGRGRLGSHVFTMLEGTTGKPSQVAPGRAAADGCV